MSLSGDGSSVAIVVDPTCEYLGQLFVEELEARGVRTVSVLSDYMAAGLAGQFGSTPPAELVAPAAGEEAEWWERTCQMPLLGAVSESDAGIATAERLASALGARFANDVSPRRRHKWLLHETLRRAGLPACAQRLCATGDEVRDMELPVVVKPARGVASDGVSVCHTVSEAVAAVEALRGAERYGGGSNERVLVQSLLVGDEYAVDTCSRAGDHKVVAVWKYDKRPTNGAPRVYYCSELASSFGALEAAVVAALDATGHTDGPTHTEVIVTDTQGPTIVEINARFHNQKFVPLAERCLGITQIQAAAAAMLEDDDAWRRVPASPTLACAGRLVHLVSCVEGPLRALNGDLWRELSSLPTSDERSTSTPTLAGSSSPGTATRLTPTTAGLSATSTTSS
ncbi:hypothetical protein CTAYLR_001165 [Chrysophaeum taylorii]|uniref:ATP-grasp domain-containing protein n=1 Tax=Chrysophaeum taylorii TaxID=2483200 RepID=A0AAD7XUP0_9STRA|nr:hypothetical protein CTAYLR_001165 [Chrysophaeum taylorii]